MGDKLEDIFKDGTVVKDSTIYEVSYKGNNFLVSSDYEYIEKVEPAYEGEWMFNENAQMLTRYNGDLTTKRGNQEVGEVIIPNYYNGKRIKSIQYAIFSGNAQLTKLTISEGIEEIGAWAFQNCSNLTGDLTIPDSVTIINGNAFYNCSSLNGRLKLSNNLVTVGSSFFLL